MKKPQRKEKKTKKENKIKNNKQKCSTFPSTSKLCLKA